MKRYFSSKKEHPVFDPTPHVLRFRELVERAVAVQGNGFKVGENDPAEGFDLWKPQSGFFSYTLADDNK
jgi:hypothetical protein